jgi:NHL repeat
MTIHIKRILPATIIAMVVMMVVAATAMAVLTSEPTKFVPSGQFGFKVDKTTGGNICTVASKDECQRGEESEQPSGFVFPETVAVAANGNVYVGDNVNNRIQEFTKTGEFVLMFGWNVNKTKVEKGAPQAERNVCTATEVAGGVVCQAGESSTGSQGQMLRIVQDLSVDQTTSSVYAYDSLSHRVDEFTGNGEFVLMIGGHVNKTKVEASASEAEENVCTAASGDVCQPGLESTPGSTAHGAFKIEGFRGDLLANGGPKDLLYVGDEARVQEFDKASGAWVGEISLAGLSTTSKATAIAVDSAGDVLVADRHVAGVHEYNEKGEPQSTVIDPENSSISAIALDAFGRIGLIEPEIGEGEEFRGLLYEVSGKEVGQFASLSGPLPGGNPKGIAFNQSKESDELYLAAPSAQMVEIYAPVVFPEVETCPATGVAATSATLCGNVNPHGILATAFFAYGLPGAIPTKTATVIEGEGTTQVPYEQQVTGLVPNQTYQFDAVVEALAEELEKQATSKILEFHTLTPAPDMPGEPVASFVKAESAILIISFNPEHATAHYHFECVACPSSVTCTISEAAEIISTPVEEYSGYGLTGAVRELQGLSPQTTYTCRLTADNSFEEERTEGGKTVLVAEGGKTTSQEGHFTTSAPPIARATTGPASGVTTTTAIVSGTVDPDGQPATYAFELGIYRGAKTEYGTVFTGSAGRTLTERSLALTGLQPGTTYAYRIAVSSGYINNEIHTIQGAPATFTTLGLPTVLPVPTVMPQLAIPNIPFPKATSPKKKPTHKKKTTKHKIKHKTNQHHKPHHK